MLTALLMLAGCFDGAPRNNPLDPRGENFDDAGGLTVQVTTFYAPQQGLSDVAIQTDPGNFAGQTDASGTVFIPDLASGTYTITASRTGYAPQMATINVTAGEFATVSIAMPGMPEFLDIDINTIHISRWWPPPQELFRLNLHVEMGDRDGLADIDQVWFEIPALDYRAELAVQTTPGSFGRLIQGDSLPAALPALLGQDMFLYASDRTGAVNMSEKQAIFRVIESSPLANAPRDLSLLETNAPILSWEAVAINYPFTYTVDVVRVDNNIQNLVRSVPDISSDSTSFQLDALAAGEYFWTVSIVDDFGNTSRSREAGFRIP